MKVIVFDLSKTLLFPKDINHKGSLNTFHQELLGKNPDYNFFDYFKLNDELLEYLKNIKDNYQLYIFTTGTIQNAFAINDQLNSIFKKIFSTKESGYTKSISDSYLKIAKEINVRPQDVIFVDDNINNIVAAKEAGLQTIRYTSNKEVISAINDLLIQ